MKRKQIVAALKRAVPGMANYGTIEYLKIAEADTQRIAKQLEVILKDNSSRLWPKLTKHMRLGMEEW